MSEKTKDVEGHHDPVISARAREVVAYIKETGTTGIAVLMVGFFLGQQAGWIPNVDRIDHKSLLEETAAQTIILKQNQQLVNKQIEQMSANQKAIMQLAWGVCMSVAKVKDQDKPCWGVGFTKD